MSPARTLINVILRPFGICLGKVISVKRRMDDGTFAEEPLPTGLKAYRVLRLRRV